MSEIIKITQIRSSIGRIPKHKATLMGLGLFKIGHTVERVNNTTIRGMIHSISYMLKVVLNEDEDK